MLLVNVTIFFLSSDLSMNTLRHIPQKLFQSTRKLTVIHLSGNSLEDLPEHIFQDLEHLEELDLSNNILTGIESGLFKGTYY
jgi:Leucine-rich repeat (LRR) protein